jgi:hypothetical protein
MRRPSLFVIATAVLLLVSAGSIASATTIDFSNLVGANGDPFSFSSQGGFDVEALVGEGDWFEAHMFGNPEPSIFAGPIGSPSISAIVIHREDGGAFTFSSVDLACNNGGACPFQFLAFLDHAFVFDFKGSVPNLDFGFVTELNPNASMVIDQLLITISPDGRPRADHRRAPGVGSHGDGSRPRTEAPQLEAFLASPSSARPRPRAPSPCRVFRPGSARR